MKKLILQYIIIMIITLAIVAIFTTCQYIVAKNGIYLTIYEKPYDTSDIVIVGDIELTIQYGLFGVDHVYGNYTVEFPDGIIYDPDINEDTSLYEKIDRLQINYITIFIWWILLSILIYRVKIIIKSKHIEENQNEN